MSRHLTRLYPFLFASVPILYYAGNHVAKFSLGDLVFILSIALVTCGMVYAIAALALARRGSKELPPFVALLAMVWFYTYQYLPPRLGGGTQHFPHRFLVAAGVAVSGVLVWWIGRRPDLLVSAARFFTLMGAILVAWSALKFGTGWIRGRSAIKHSVLALELARPIQGPAQPAPPLRDIYVMVLDQYANSTVLRERFGFDNRPFEDSLRALGFHVPKVVRSNYFHTLLSLPSLLNSAHLTALEHDLGRSATAVALPDHLVEHNRVVAYLAARGYRYAFFPSQWWSSTSGSSTADLVYHPWSGFDFTRRLNSGELPRRLRGESVLRYLDRDHRWEAAHVRRTLEGVAALSRSGKPVFAFAHVLKPHDPYVFDRHCGTLARQRQDDDVGPYLDQVECLNRLVLATVRKILQEHQVPPIIILQGDHGTQLLGAPDYRRAEDVPPDAARERFGAFGAYYLPDGGAAAFGDTVTVVNVLGNVLRYYFGARLPRASDRMYLSTAAMPYDLRGVDARWLAGHDSPKAGAGAGH